SPRGGGTAAQASGTSKRAVRDQRALGRGKGKRSVRRHPPPDVYRSRAPRLLGGDQWDCPFSREAEFAGVDNALVTLKVHVSSALRDAQAVVSRARSKGPPYNCNGDCKRSLLTLNLQMPLRPYEPATANIDQRPSDVARI